MVRSFGAAVAGTLLVALVSTLGDLVWFGLRLPHRAVYGLAHGTLLMASMGLVLGAVARKPLDGAAGGAAIGLGAAGAYYVLSPAVGPAVMFVIWMGIWILLAALARRLGGSRLDWAATLARGGIAAVLSGLAFYAISGIWFERPAGGRSYSRHFASWTIAYLPAFVALVCQPRRPRSSR